MDRLHRFNSRYFGVHRWFGISLVRFRLIFFFFLDSFKYEYHGRENTRFLCFTVEQFSNFFFFLFDFGIRYMYVYKKY